MTPRLTFRTTHPQPGRVAAAVRPDNTQEMSSTVEDGTVVTIIERPDVSSLRATADDYLRTLAVADEAATQLVSRVDTDEADDGSLHDGGGPDGRDPTEGDG